jgi:hypothetical protein
MAKDIYGNPVKVLYGDKAVSRMEKDLGREVSQFERRVIVEEGYVDEPYWDTADPPVLTQGVGQTGKWIERGFEASFKHHVERAKKKVPGFDKYPDYLKEELIQSEYRGDLGQSPTAMRQFRAGEYEKASKEFLNSNEYRKTTTSQGIKNRMKATSDAMMQYGQEQKKQLTSRMSNQQDMTI